MFFSQHKFAFTFTLSFCTQCGVQWGGWGGGNVYRSRPGECKQSSYLTEESTLDRPVAACLFGLSAIGPSSSHGVSALQTTGGRRPDTLCLARGQADGDGVASDSPL